MEENLDENAIREIEEVLNTKIYPGTEIMKDVGSHHFVKSQNSASADVLVPQPSDDPADPLNWSPRWKAVALFAALYLGFWEGLGPLALAPMFEEYVEEWNRSLADVIQFTGISILVLGFSNFFWVPISVSFGRRPVAIFSMIICAASSIWRARATSYNSFLGACVLSGFAAGPCETLPPQVISDVIFLHDRGKYNTLYFALYFISLTVGPVISGPMAFHYGWRSFWWLNTGFLLLGFLIMLTFPETRYARAPPDPQRAATKTAAGITEKEKESKDASETDAKAEIATDEKVGSGTPTGADGEDGLGTVVTRQDPWLGRGAPTKAQFALWAPYEGGLFREFWIPWYLHAFPIVELAAFIVSFSASGFLVVNLSQTQAFAAPPYNFSSQTIGLFNLAVLVGALIGLFTNGPLSDWIAAYLTRRNNGVREPEMRLVAMIPYVAIVIVGSVVVAVGYDLHYRWPIIVIVGYTALGIQVTALPSIASTYAVDSYKPVTGSLFVAITVNKNVWGYGVSRFLPVWSEESGFRAPILFNMALIVLWCACAIIFWFYGKKFRGLSKNSFVHKL